MGGLRGVGGLDLELPDREGSYCAIIAIAWGGEYRGGSIMGLYSVVGRRVARKWGVGRISVVGAMGMTVLKLKAMKSNICGLVRGHTSIVRGAVNTRVRIGGVLIHGVGGGERNMSTSLLASG